MKQKKKVLVDEAKKKVKETSDGSIFYSSGKECIAQLIKPEIRTAF